MIRYNYLFLPLGLCLAGIHSLANAQEAKRRFPVPEPKYHVRIEKSVMVPMRDGTKLSTDLYFPEGGAEKFPAIMIRTPYNKNSEWLQSEARLYAGQGYVVAFQDVRGKFESEGEYVVSSADTNDGSDLVDWLASQPWSTGKVGTAGCSYMGENQVEMAKVRNPRHAAMIPRAASGGMQYFGSLRGGAFELGASADWFLIQEGIQRARYREGFNKKVWMKPGEAYKVAINLNATSNYFGPGHRIRLEVSSSNFPRFDRNLNTGGNNYDETKWRLARNTILHDLERPSHIVLPVIP
jgi:predicted acyl esterase